MTPEEVNKLTAGALKLITRLELLIALSRELPPEIKEKLNQLGHGSDPDTDFMCSAHSEGQQCCLDILAGEEPAGNWR